MDILECGHSVFWVGNQARGSAHVGHSVCGSLLNDSVPGWVGEIEDKILGSIVDGSSENFGP